MHLHAGSIPRENGFEIMPFEFTTSYLSDSIALFRQYKKFAEIAIGQLTMSNS